MTAANLPPILTSAADPQICRRSEVCRRSSHLPPIRKSAADPKSAAADPKFAAHRSTAVLFRAFVEIVANRARFSGNILRVVIKGGAESRSLAIVDSRFTPTANLMDKIVRHNTSSDLLSI